MTLLSSSFYIIIHLLQLNRVHRIIQLLHTLLFFFFPGLLLFGLFMTGLQGKPQQLHKHFNRNWSWDLGHSATSFLGKQLGMSYPFKLWGCQRAMHEGSELTEMGSRGIGLSRFCRPRLGAGALWWWHGGGPQLQGAPELSRQEADFSLSSTGLISSLLDTLCVCAQYCFNLIYFQERKCS